MKTLPVWLAAQPRQSAWAIKITRLDGEVFGLTSANRRQTVGGVSYAPGLSIGSMDFTSGLAAGNLKVTIVDTDEALSRAEVAAGRWDGAAVEIFRYHWSNTADTPAPVVTGSLGNVTPVGVQFEFELRDLRQPLQQDNTAVLQPTCRYRFGDAKCTLDEGDFTHALEVTAVADNHEFTDSALSAATENFTEGEIRWLTGDNAGLSSKVRTEAAGVFELAVATVYPIQVGDTADLIEGCLKTREACKAFGNILNFGGEPDKPTLDTLTAPAEPE